MNRRILYGLGALGIVILAVLVWFFALSPIRNETAKVQEAIDQEHSKQMAAQAKLARAEATRTEGRKNEARLLELAKMVPNDPEIPSLLLQIQNLADEAGVTFLAVTPGTPIQSGQYEIVPLEVQFTGTFFDLSDFVYRAEQMVAGPGRLLAVKEITLQTNLGSMASGTTGSTTETTLPTATGPILKVSMTLYAFDTGSQAASTATTSTPTTAGTGTGGATTPTTSSGGGTVTTATGV